LNSTPPKSGRCRRDWNGSGCNLVRPTEFRDTGPLMQSGVTRNLGERPRPETLTESYWSNCGESRSGNLQIERTALKSVQCRETGPRTETGAEPVGDNLALKTMTRGSMMARRLKSPRDPISLRGGGEMNGPAWLRLGDAMRGRGRSQGWGASERLPEKIGSRSRRAQGRHLVGGRLFWADMARSLPRN
jgi:hypothetical protein